MEDKDKKKLFFRRALFYTNTAYLLVDMANTMLTEADGVLTILYKKTARNEKQLFGQALKVARDAWKLTKNAAKGVYEIRETDDAQGDSDYLLEALLLIIDRTKDNVESKKEILDHIKAMPSYMKIDEWLREFPEIIEEKEVDLKLKVEELKKYGRVEISNYIICEYRTKDYIAFNIMHSEGKAFITLSYYTDSPNVGWLNTLCVSNECQKQGIGSDILEFAEMLAREMEMTELNATLENMDWRHDWYNKLGFEDNFHDSTMIITKKL